MKILKYAFLLNCGIGLVCFATKAHASSSFNRVRSEFGHAISRTIDPLEGTWDCRNVKFHSEDAGNATYSFTFSFDSKNKLVDSEHRFVGRDKETGEIFLVEEVSSELEKDFVIRVTNDGKLIMEHIINFEWPGWNLPYSKAVAGKWTISYLTCERRN